MHRHPDYTRERIRQLAERIHSRIYTDARPVSDLLVCPAVGRISYNQAMKLRVWRRARLGDPFGPLWTTYWFKGRFRVPRQWAERRLDLIWISHSEATLWMGGRVIQGLNHEPLSYDKSSRPDAPLAPRATAGQVLRFEIEMACNKVFGKADAPFATVSPFILDRCDVAVFDPHVWDLYHDLATLQQLEAELNREAGSSDRAFAGELLAGLNRFANAFDESDRSTWPAARRLLRPLLARRNSSTTHELSAIGHAHIDTAWLWPLAETDRKCQRTFSSQLMLMDEYPAHRFACSQAYQYARMKERNPDLWKRITEKVKAGQFISVGGTWIEPDCNIPSGESLVRQFLYGQRFFEREFGRRCNEFWNPDVFGYNGQLPQIMRLAGIRRFLTQKLSWNRFNKPQHHTFTWQGIDGSEVLAHFPPADTYNAMASIPELRKNMRDYKDHDRSRHSFMLFGFGDGGGGPTRTMLETLSRAKDLQGLPRTRIRTSDEFFTLLERDCTDRALLIGELYFEYHRGTYTSQAATKRANRKCEVLLHDVEFLSHASGVRYPRAELDRLWKLLLLNQFHDILPGSSITLVYDDAAKQFADIEQSGTRLRDRAVGALVPRGKNFIPVNTTGFDRAEVVELPGGTLAFAQAPSYGTGELAAHVDEVTIHRSRKSFVLENWQLRAMIGTSGRLLSLIDKRSGRDALAGEGNALKLYDDHPTAWDAWDVDPFHLETERAVPPARSCRVITQNILRGEIEFEYKLGRRSRMRQTVRLDANARRLEFHCDVEWREDHQMLKVAFPTSVRAMNATYEMQFGCVERPTHFNTSFDLARYEVPAHRWADLSEHGFGVALLSESKYGFSTFANVMRMSLLRAPKHPDPQADMGQHHFAYAVMPHGGGWREAGVVAEGYKFNMPMLVVRGRAAGQHSFASVDDPNLVIDTIKCAEDSDDTIVRLYECHGARGTARLRVGWPVRSARLANILEDALGAARVRDGSVEIEYTPFQIITLKLIAPAAGGVMPRSRARRK